MNRNWKAIVWAVALSMVWVLASPAQEARPLPKRGDRVTVEGKITYIQANGPPIWEMKTAEGNLYRIQVPFGTFAELQRAGFNAKVGEKILVVGDVVCVMSETPVIAGREITSRGKTYRMPRGPISS